MASTRRNTGPSRSQHAAAQGSYGQVGECQKVGGIQAAHVSISGARSQTPSVLGTTARISVAYTDSQLPPTFWHSPRRLRMRLRQVDERLPSPFLAKRIGLFPEQARTVFVRPRCCHAGLGRRLPSRPTCLHVAGSHDGHAEVVGECQKVWGNQAAHASVAGVLPGPRFWGDIVDACELLVDHRVDNPLYDPGRGTRLPQRCRLAVCGSCGHISARIRHCPTLFGTPAFKAFE